MSRTLVLLLIGAVAVAEEHAFVETETPRQSCFVHEPLRLTLRVGFDAEYFETHAVQMFHRQLDVPLQVQAPWLEALPGTVIRAEAAVRDGSSFVLNGAVVHARVREGSPFAVIEIERTYLPTRAGKLVIPAPDLRFAHATRFSEDFVHGRVALDRRDALVRGEALALTVHPLPAEGRPPGFNGAVGRGISVRAEAASRSVDAGAIFKLVLRVEGEGNLELFETPRLDGLAEGFHVYGAIDDRQPARRTIAYDIAALDARLTEIPPIPFVYFDAGARTYRTVRTEPLPLTVRGAVRPLPAEERSGTLPTLLQVAAVLAVVVFALLLGLRARARRRRAPADPRARFRERAGADLAAALTGYLAAHLRCPAASVIAPNLPARLERAGVPADLAARASAMLERLVAARYGGTTPDDSTEQAARALVDALEASLHADRFRTG